MTTAREVLDRCDALAACSDAPERLDRAHLTPALARAHGLVAGWMAEAGLRTWRDQAGNLCGRTEGREPGLPALLLGSHLDTVPDAGRYDGMLGVLLGIAVAQRLRDEVPTWPCALEVVGFTDEEGARFGTALMGSRALAGTWDDAWWDLRDASGTTVAQAARDFGLDPGLVGTAARRPQDLVAYLEAHIEQGPLLEAADRSLGVVTTIAGARRFLVEVVGEARHAGGTPYPRRRDALVGAAEAIVLVERTVRGSDAIATVGRIEVEPGAVNVIPGRAVFTVDLRAATDDARDAMRDTLLAGIAQVCAARGLGMRVTDLYEAPATPCADRLRDALRAGVVATGDAAPLDVWSRAGHDGMAVSAVTDVGMLFVRCHDGISHHPAEAVREVDVAAALDAFTAAVRTVGATAGSGATVRSGATVGSGA
ncbi:amidase, hydantoinase/carbamoylase family [Cellulomonas flavigena DSM 20109]|uniref:Amidase, hydantoinase/carbamoylase family n=1 Tax=Cellulomonas flavigena (strain ATCC 482 / DSM 20109 / BCRC 11376 / JCM 18109 / NBRC 3775 / NCIMB 8073 / NRS 134) TaxID=446466 RepID=D5UJN3_CELFN|nr:allantoate amidohydrolase [Cellulomonas flavigena]ADG75671.1 amidase, hydantoinase/carbamoylase family [Cellulomonas flavigena DSM 20109]